LAFSSSTAVLVHGSIGATLFLMFDVAAIAAFR